jgi:CBS-domain-containing membrane protein
VPTPKKYPRCTALNADYPHGVGRPGATDHTTDPPPVTNFYVSKTVYDLNTARDADKDGVACERH